MTIQMASGASEQIAQVPGNSCSSSSCPDLRETAFAPLVISELVGQGHRCRAFAARADDRDLILKVYYPRAVAKHARRCGGSIARYEFERNAAFRRFPVLAGFIATPIAFHSSPQAELFLQERVRGEPLLTFLRTCTAVSREHLLAQLRTILEYAHQAGLFDLDLHPSNVIVKRQADSTVRPMLFDFNKVPYHVKPPNAFVGWLVAIGLIGRRSRDYRYWRRLGAGS